MYPKIWIIALFQMFMIGLSVHVLTGNSVEVIMTDAKNAFFIILAGFCLLVICFTTTMNYYLLKNRHVYRRNREATRLCNKVLSGTATRAECQKFQNYRDMGVLTFNGTGVLRLSDQAVRDLFQ